MPNPFMPNPYMPSPGSFPPPSRFDPSGGALAINPAWPEYVESLRHKLPPELGTTTDTIRHQGLALHVNAGACGVSLAQGQAYTLRITANGIDIESATRAGVRYALETLAQWLATPNAGLPLGIVQDAPAFATRGVMLDVSRCRIPTMPEFARIIDQLAALKCNHLQLYTEHTFAYSFAESVWQGWSPITPTELSTIDTLCRARGIELAANQNCFGHLRNWLETPDFASLAETHGDWMFDLWPRSGPFSLCPTDSASIAFVRRLLQELTPNVRSPLLNIGCDETYDIAFGRSKAACAARGRATVFAEFVAAIAQEASALGKRSMFWADIALTHPQSLALLPKDMIALAWGYEPSSPFEDWGKSLASSGLEFWVCPGTSSWRSITGRTTERNGNIDAAVAAGLKHGATGVLICDWGDTGHWQQWPIAINAIAAGLGAAWTGRPVVAHDTQSLSRVIFGPSSPHLAQRLDALGDVDLPLREVCGPLSHPTRTRLLNQSALFIDLFKKPDEQTAIGDAAQWQTALEQLHAQKASLVAAAATNPLIAAEVAHTLNLTDFALRRAFTRRFPFDGATVDPSQWHALKAEHRRLWRLRSRDGGLAQSCTFFDTVESHLTEASTHP